MTKSKPKPRLIFFALLAVPLLVLLMFMPKHEAIVEEEKEVTRSRVSLPEDKIVKFVLDKVSDVLKLFPQ